MNIQQTFNSGRHIISKNKNGIIDTVMVKEKIILETSVGNMIPRYTYDGDGRKKEAAVKFYKTGELKALPLENQTEINTSVGTIKSELLIFKKSGALWRTFPLDGQISGFWTEENEFELAENIELSTSVGTIKVKPIYLQFYETGELESILFWPGEQVKIHTSKGEILIHKGICFYPNGNIKGYEPVEEISVETKIGKLKVHDPDPNGMLAESNAISFYEDGTIHNIITSSNLIIAYNDEVEQKTFSPKIVTSYCNENDFFINPLKITFEDGAIVFENKNESAIAISSSLQFKISDFVSDKPIACVGCS